MIEKTPSIAVEQVYAALCHKTTLLILRKSANARPIFFERMTGGQKRRAFLVKIKFIAKKILRR